MQADASTLGRPSIIREASRIVREEGIRAFWKGNGVTIVHRLPYSAISFYAYEKYKRVSAFCMTCNQYKLFEAICNLCYMKVINISIWSVSFRRSRYGRTA
jgi:hypothetical protein